MNTRISMAIIMLVIIILACGVQGSEHQSAAPAAPASVPVRAVSTFVPTSVPVSSSDLKIIEYLTVQTDFLDGCASALDWFAQVMNVFEMSDAWQNMALDANTSAIYNCSTLGGYSNVPPLLVTIQNEIDGARSDFGTAFEYARQGITYYDAPSLDNAIIYMDRGAAHISKGTDLLSVVSASYK